MGSNPTLSADHQGDNLKTAGGIPAMDLQLFALNRLHLESSVLADKFEFRFVESVEAQFEEILVAEAEGAGK